jgi:hypothetical protein
MRSDADMDTALTWLIRFWIVVAVALNIAAVVMTGGAWKELEIFRPLSLANLVAQVIVFSPAVLAYIWREKRRAKAGPTRAAPHAGSQADTPSAARDDKVGLRRDIRPVEREDRAGVRGDIRPAERDDRAGLRGDTRSAERDPKAGLRGNLRSAEPDEQFERLFENFPPKRPI